MNAAPDDSAPALDPPEGWVIRPASSAAGAEPLRIWGLTPEERLLRSLRRAGCRNARVVEPAQLPPARGAVLALRGDVVLDERLVEGLRDAPDTLLTAPHLGPIGAHVAGARAAGVAAALVGHADAALAGLRRAGPRELAPAYVAALRKREPPFALPARSEHAGEVERRIFAASYKGVSDLVTLWVWPRPARAATRWCVRHGVHPNAVTIASWALALATAGFFARGEFAAGLACGWCMTFLDTVDGKLARVTLTSSRLGNVLDHGLDLLHPPFWWWAFGAGLGPGHEFATAVVVGGYLVGRALEGAFLAAFGFETHSWRPIDGLFRTVTARRNPNLILLTVGTVAGRPDLGFAMVALWTAVSLGFHGLRLLQAWRLRTLGLAVTPWEAA